ncbi:hypothetical protein PINS_up004890 [Pythium insidiosum]|nr:hypothetical protein PINS_up004890 [Pythium insidiosum]
MLPTLVTSLRQIGRDNSKEMQAFEDTFLVLDEFVQELSTPAVINLIISAGVHVSLLELLNVHNTEDGPVVHRVLQVIQAMTRTRRIRLLVLESGPALTSLVDMYHETSADFARLEGQQKAIAKLAGGLIVQLSSDPLEFRKVLFDHRGVLPVTIIDNLLSRHTELATTAEEIVANLVESDFATCPMWIDLVETASIERLFRVMVAAKRPSVRITAARKVTEVVNAHPEALSGSLSPLESSTLMTMLLDLLVDLDQRTSVIGILAVALLLSYGQKLDDEQTHRLATDGAVSLMYWMQKGTVRHQDNAISILYDGLMPSPGMIDAFFQQLRQPPAPQDSVFLRVVTEQMMEMKLSQNADSIVKRCSLLTRFFGTIDLASLPDDENDLLRDLAKHLLQLLSEEDECRNVKCLPSVFEFLDALAQITTHGIELTKLGAIETVLQLLKMLDADETNSTELVQDARRGAKVLLKSLFAFDIQRVVSANGVNEMLAVMATQGSSSVDDMTPLLDLFDAIRSCGSDGTRALVESTTFLSSLENGLHGDDGILSRTSDPNWWHDTERFEVASRICLMLFDVTRYRDAREHVFAMPELLLSTIQVIEILVQMLLTEEELPTDTKNQVVRVLGASLPFIECASVSAERLFGGDDDSERVALWRRVARIFVQTLTSFSLHESVGLLRIGFDAVVTMLHNSSMMAALSGDDVLVELRSTLDAHSTQAVDSSLYSVEAMASMVNAYLYLDAGHTSQPLVDLVVHVIVTTVEFEKHVDLSGSVLLLAKVCSNGGSREALYDHKAYAQLLDALSAMCSSPVWRHFRATIHRVLLLLGEEVSSDVSARLSMSSAVGNDKTSSSNGITSAPVTIRCVACSQLVTVTAGSQLATAKCAKCGQLVVSTSSMEPASAEQKSSATEESAIVCQICTKTLYVPPGVDATDVQCPNCGQAPAFKAANRQRNGSEAPEPDARPPTSGAAPLQDMKDTKVVSCGHCNKHLIVKSSATAVKCPRCQGVSKLSSNTTQEVMRCQNCNTLLSLPAGAKAYKCMNCLHTTRLS